MFVLDGLYVHLVDGLWCFAARDADLYWRHAGREGAADRAVQGAERVLRVCGGVPVLQRIRVQGSEGHAVGKTTSVVRNSCPALMSRLLSCVVLGCIMFR